MFRSADDTGVAGLYSTLADPGGMYPELVVGLTSEWRTTGPEPLGATSAVRPLYIQVLAVGVSLEISQ
jgi:hypothetical protein